MKQSGTGTVTYADQKKHNATGLEKCLSIWQAAMLSHRNGRLHAKTMSLELELSKYKQLHQQLEVDLNSEPLQNAMIHKGIFQ